MNNPIARPYRYISADSHLEIDSKYWLDRVPERYCELAPRLVRQSDDSDAWMIGEKIIRPAAAADLYGGKGRDKYVPFYGRYEGTPGTGNAEQRLREQDRDGIDAESSSPRNKAGRNSGGAPTTMPRINRSCVLIPAGLQKNIVRSLRID